MSNIVMEIVKNLIQSTLLKILMDKILPYILKLFNCLNTISYYYIFLYISVSVVILFILYKLYIYFKSHKSHKLSSLNISSILSRDSDFDLEPKKMEKKKLNISSKSKKIFTTDLLSSI